MNRMEGKKAKRIYYERDGFVFMKMAKKLQDITLNLLRQ